MNALKIDRIIKMLIKNQSVINPRRLFNTSWLKND